MLSEIKVSSSGNSFELMFTKGKFKGNICTSLSIMGEFILGGLAPDGRLRAVSCTPCAPVRVQGASPMEKGGVTKYLGALISFTGWTGQWQHIQYETEAFFQRMDTLRPNFRQFCLLLQSLLALDGDNNTAEQCAAQVIEYLQANDYLSNS